MAQYSVDADTMLKAMDDFWSYDDLLHAAENLITAGNNFGFEKSSEITTFENKIPTFNYDKNNFLKYSNDHVSFDYFVKAA